MNSFLHVVCGAGCLVLGPTNILSLAGGSCNIEADQVQDPDVLVGTGSPVFGIMSDPGPVFKIWSDPDPIFKCDRIRVL